MRIYVLTYVATVGRSPVESANAAMDGRGGPANDVITGDQAHERILLRATSHQVACNDRRQSIATATDDASSVLASNATVSTPRHTVDQVSVERGNGQRGNAFKPGKSIEAGAPTPTSLADPSEIGSSLLRGSLHSHSGVRTDRRQTA